MATHPTHTDFTFQRKFPHKSHLSSNNAGLTFNQSILERNNTMKLITTALCSALLSINVLAQTAATPVAATTASAATAIATAANAMPAKDMAEAEVRKVDKDAKKVTLKHGPIKSLDMPGMTMVFQIKDAALFDKFAVGDKIMFTAEQQQGAYVMTSVEKVAPK